MFESVRHFSQVPATMVLRVRSAKVRDQAQTESVGTRFRVSVFGLQVSRVDAVEEPQRTRGSASLPGFCATIFGEFPRRV